MRSEKTWRGTFPVSPEAISATAEWLEATVGNENLSDRLIYSLKLCVDELMSNTLLHGCQNRKEVVASIQIKLSTSRVELIYEDNGLLFDVTNAPERRLNMPLEEIEPGGLGLKLVREFSSELRYENIPNGNRIICIFVRNAQQSWQDVKNRY